MRRSVTAIALAATLLAAPRAARPQAEGPDVAAADVLRALDRGVEFLKRSQSPRGNWVEVSRYPGGVTSLCTLALINAGVPPEDPNVQRALRYLRNIEPTMTYSTALQTMVFCAAEPRRDLVLIRRNVRWLERVQLKQGNHRGSFPYGPGNQHAGRGDNSNGQFALLALHEAEKVGVAVKDATWELSHNYWKEAQNPDGSWGYQKRSKGTGSMTAAGIAGMVITSGRSASRDARVVGDRVNCCVRKEESLELQRALAWLGRNFSVERNPGGHGRSYYFYYLYGLERAGRLTARRLIGGHDWYRAGAAAILSRQDTLAGAWQGSTGREITTSMALLFLAKGRRPVVVAKLRHGPGEDWEQHRSDLQHLTRYTESRWQRDLTWQIIDGREATVDDLRQTPVLFVAGSVAPRMNEEQVRRLRDYIDRGGFIFAVANCKGDGFDTGFRALMEQVFPEKEFRLRLLEPEHPVWHAEERVDPRMVRPLWGIDYGCRTCVVFCPEDLSCFWELGEAERGKAWPAPVARKVQAALSIGVNVLTYATGREPKHKDAIPRKMESDVRPSDDARGTLNVAKLLHPGGCNAAPAALKNLVQRAGHELKVPVATLDEPLAMTDKGLFRHHLVFMHGRHQFRLTAEERTALGTYLERGGTLLVDAICASPEFAESFRREIAAILPEHPLERIPADDPIFTPEFGGYDIRTVSRRRPEGGDRQALHARVRRETPDLEAIVLGERYGVIFSPYDLSCALEDYESLECNGYVREDAARIGLNVILYSLHR